MFRKKPAHLMIQEAESSRSLKRVLTSFDLILLGIGAIVGTGVFVLSGVAAGRHSGNALPLSFVIAGIACLFAALCYSEFSTMIPVSGSAYTYCYTALGEIWAWIIGWDLILEYGLAISAVAIGWSGYLCTLLGTVGIQIPDALTHPPVEGGIINFPAILIVLLLTGLLIIGIKKSTRANAVIVAIKIAGILLFLFLGSTAINPGNWEPFMPPNGMWGVFSGAAVVFFAFIGFDAVVTAAEETENPQRSLPIGILGSLIVCIILYVIVGFVLTGLVPAADLVKTNEAAHAPIAYALDQVGFKWAAGIVSVGALCGITSVLLVMLFGQTRILFAMSRDGLVPRLFSDVHPRTHSPVKVTIFVGVITAFVAGLFPLDIVAELVNMGTLVAFSIVAIGVILLRHYHPELKRPFRCPLVPVIPILCIGSCLVLITTLSPNAHIMFVVWLCIGLLLYFMYGLKNSMNRLRTSPGEMEPIPCHINPETPIPDPKSQNPENPRTDTAIPDSGSIILPDHGPCESERQ
jgi:APA family basic amino acid/polyamine antiporter